MELATILDTDLLAIDGSNKLTVKGLRETAGPTDLAIGSVADGQILKRSGTSVVGQSGKVILQTVYAEITTDQSTTDASAPGPDLFSQAITTVAGSDLMIHFNASGSTSGSFAVRFKLYVDGVLRKKAVMSATTSSNSVCMIYKQTGLSAGAHTVSVEWYLTSAGTGAISAATNDGHGASLLLTEML